MDSLSIVSALMFPPRAAVENEIGSLQYKQSSRTLNMECCLIEITTNKLPEAPPLIPASPSPVNFM